MFYFTKRNTKTVVRELRRNCMNDDRRHWVKIPLIGRSLYERYNFLVARNN